MRKFVGNAFSLQMLPSIAVNECGKIEYDIVSENVFKEFAKGAKSIVGHEDTARVLGVEFNRESVTLEKGDVLLVAQLVGGRLPEGATTLPENCHFKYFSIRIYAKQIL